MKRTFLLSLLTLLLSSPAWAYNFTVNGIYYNILSEEDLTCEVTCLFSNSSNEDAYSGNVIVPETVTYSNNAYSVVAIGAYAFSYCSALQSVTIPNSVTSIGDYAFYNAPYLKTVTIGNSVTSIGNYAFYGCSSIEELTIPNFVTSIEEYTFYGCSSIEELTIPNSVTSIGWNAFGNCSGLPELTLPEKLETVDSNAFYGSSNISIVTSLNPEPPSCSSSSFTSDTKDSGILYVPVGTTKIYSNADGWKTFKHIVPLDLVIPTITTTEATDITLSTAVLNGSIALGNEDILKVGFEYWIDGGSTYDITASYTDDDMVSATINGLKENTKYYYRAYAETESTLYYYGDKLSFTTEAKIPPTVTTLEATDITYYSATLNGSVVSGNEYILNVGFEFEDGSIIYDTTASYIGESLFSVTVDDYWYACVEGNTTYYYRAYAKTDSGTYYGEDVSFTTEVNGIDGIATDGAEIVGYYSTDGQQITSPTKGVNIVRLSDGATKKIIVK